MDRAICKTKINNSMEKRTSTIENVYNCNNDHQCELHQNEVNSVECPESEEEPNILIRAIDLIIQDQDMFDSSLITSDESMVISPNNTIDRSGQKKRITSTPAVTTPVWKNVDEYASIMTSDRSRTTNINTSNSSDWSINEQQNNPITLYNPLDDLYLFQDNENENDFHFDI